MPKAAVGTVAKQHCAVVKRLDGYVAEMAGRIILYILCTAPRKAVVARQRGGKRRALAAAERLMN